MSEPGIACLDLLKVDFNRLLLYTLFPLVVKLLQVKCSLYDFKILKSVREERFHKNNIDTHYYAISSPVDLHQGIIVFYQRNNRVSKKYLLKQLHHIFPLLSKRF